MIKESVTPYDVCDLLNELFELDPDMVNELIKARVPCNEKISSHPTVQVRAYKGEPNTVNIIGILNGIFGADDETGFGCICYEVDDDGILTGFRLLSKDEWI